MTNVVTGLIPISNAFEQSINYAEGEFISNYWLPCQKTSLDRIHPMLSTLISVSYTGMFKTWGYGVFLCMCSCCGISLIARRTRCSEAYFTHCSCMGIDILVTVYFRILALLNCGLNVKEAAEHITSSYGLQNVILYFCCEFSSDDGMIDSSYISMLELNFAGLLRVVVSMTGTFPWRNWVTLMTKPQQIKVYRMYYLKISLSLSHRDPL